MAVDLHSTAEGGAEGAWLAESSEWVESAQQTVGWAEFAAVGGRRLIGVGLPARELVVALLLWQRDFPSVEQRKWAGHSNVAVTAAVVSGVWQVLTWLGIAAVEREKDECK